MNDKLKLEVILAAVDKATRPLRAIREASGETSKALKAARDSLKALNDQQKTIDAWRSTDKAIGINRTDLAAARAEVERMAKEIKAVPVPTVKMQRAFEEATQRARNLAATANRLQEKKQRLRQELGAAGIDTKKLADAQRDLKTRIEAAAVAVEKEDAALKAVNKRLQAYHAAKANYDKSMATAGKLRSAGMAVAGAGAAIGLPVGLATKDYATFEDAMLGVAKQVDGARDANGRLTETYHQMGREIKALSERIPMATTEIARIVEAGARMGIQGRENLMIYAETTAVMAEAFELPVDLVGEQIGKLSNLYKIPIKDIKELGDTINWLDDSALSKGGDIIEVMQRVAGSASMVNMNFREAAALGSTFLSLGSTAEVASSATNAMIRELSVATMQSKRFKAGLDMIKLDAKAVQLGMSKDATGTILKVLDAIKALPREQQLEAATRLFGKEFGDDAAKLAENLGEYRRQLGLVNAAEARHSMDREARARKDTINARLLMAKNALFNLSSDLGEHLKPALVETLEKTLGILQSIRQWAAENPGFASGLMTVAKWLALAGTVIGTLMIAVSGILVPIAMFKFGLAAVGLQGFSFMTVLKSIGTGILWLGRLMLANPLGLALTLLATAAFLIYQNWEPIKAFFGDLWDWIKAKADATATWFTSLPSRFMAAGAAMIDGLMSGISAKWDALKTLVTGLADSTVGWLKDVLGIRSPSRVFAEIGSFTMAGLEQGIEKGTGAPLSALRHAARQLAGAGAGMLIGGSVAAMPAIDSRPPLRGVGAGGGIGHVEIHVHAAPGQSAEDIATQVRRQLQALLRDQSAARRSRLTDPD